MSMDITILPLKLRVEVLRARNLIAADSNGRSDPYCIVTVGQTSTRTSIQPSSLNPEWMQSMVFFSQDLEPFALVQETCNDTKFRILLFGYIVVEVWDYDIGNPDDFLGKVILPLSSFPLCPSSMAETSEEVWYSLSRQNSKEEVKGELQLKIQLEAIEDNITLANMDVNKDLVTVTKCLGFQVPVQLGNSQIIDYPGSTEVVEIAFSKVYIELSIYRSEALVLLTNYRLIILSVGDLKGTKIHSLATSPQASANISTDLSMWIALNNIERVEHGTGNTVVRRQASGAAENVDSYSITIYCYDCREVRLVFVIDSDQSGVTMLKPGEDKPILPKKLLKRVSEQALHIERQVKLKKNLMKLKRVLPKKAKDKRDKATSFDSRRRSDAFCVDKNPANDTSNLVDDFVDIGPDPIMSSFKFGADISNSDDDLTSLADDEEIFIPLSQVDECLAAVYNEEGEDDTEIPLDQFKKPDISVIEAAYQGLTLPTPTKALVFALLSRLDNLVNNIVNHPPAFNIAGSDLQTTNDWNVEKLVHKDMCRLMNEKWRECKLNADNYSICPTYPPYLYVPADASDDLITEVAKFRSKGRIPSLVWMDSTAGTFLLRSAQPLPGLADKHSHEDEALIKYAMVTCPSESGLTIFDARSSSAATGNRIMGKGTEDVSRYNGCKLMYLDIPNIHAIRDSYDGVKTLALSTSSSKWLSTLENTQWLEYISIILRGSSIIARYIKLQSGNALIHCSDGWDRTAQLTSLAQLMMDPHYRTIDGFMTLIYKEWLAYGHKFHERLGEPLHPNERSPIFFQFLDCVHQIMNQYPNAFEFKMSLLLFIAEQLNTAWFGTFLYNCHRERIENNIFTETLPISAHITAMKDNYLNHRYKETKELLTPSWTIRRLRLWEEYFLACDGTSIVQVTAMEFDIGGPTTNPEGIAFSQFPTDHNSGETVVWVSDDKVKVCLLCHQKFAIHRRKHHCRNCGHIFCAECSHNKAVLPSLGYLEPVRVCNECFRLLSSSQSSPHNIQEYSDDDFQVLEQKK